MKRLALLGVAAGALGGVVALLTAGRVWGSAVAPTAARQHVSVTGSQVVPSLHATGLALLALAVAALVASSVMKRLAAALGVLVGATVVATVLNDHGNLGKVLAQHAFGVREQTLPANGNAWWIVALIGGVLAVGGFAAVLVVGSTRSALGAKYDAPTKEAPAPSEATTWDALDRGHDPTV